MPSILFIGDEISASGFRLAGVDIFVPEFGGESQLFDKLQENTDVIIITAQIAAAIPQQRMEQLMQMDKPLLMVLTDMRDELLAPDISVTLRHQLGMTE
jgi:vacuolar-type H+-ATPase subunit F/Vma7